MVKVMADGDFEDLGCFTHTMQLIIHDGIFSQRAIIDSLAICRQIMLTPSGIRPLIANIMLTPSGIRPLIASGEVLRGQRGCLDVSNTLVLNINTPANLEGMKLHLRQ